MGLPTKLYISKIAGLFTSAKQSHFDKAITCVISFNPHNHQERYKILSPFHRERYRGDEFDELDQGPRWLRNRKGAQI